MISRANFVRAVVAACGLGLGASAASAETLPKPTKAEMMEAIRKHMDDVYLSDNGKSIWGNTDISLVITEPKIGALASKQMYHGKMAQPVWPVRLTATVTVNSTKRSEPRTIVWGGKPTDAWFFHKNAFGEWVWKLGSE